MKKKKCIAAGALAAFLLCESLFTPNLAGMGAGLESAGSGSKRSTQ